MGQSPAEKFQEPNSKNQGPSSKNQEPMSFWNLVLGNWFLNLNSGWNIQINPRRIGGQRKSERGAVILSIGGELDRPGSFRQATPLAEGQ
jgi:hypothetical protein